MAGMTANSIRDFVRTSIDVDDEDIPDVILDVWLQDAVTRIISYFDESPTFLQVEYSFETEVDQQSYNLDTLALFTNESASPVTTAVYPLQVIDEVRGPNYSLTPRQHRQVRESYRGDAPSGRPQEFSFWGRDLYLWPKPSSVETYYLLGVRQPNWDWTANDLEPDLPEEFHVLVAHWALARAYAQQDDPEMANFFRAEFEGTLRSLASRFMTNTMALPMVLNGAGSREPYRTSNVLGPLTYDWE